MKQTIDKLKAKPILFQTDMIQAARNDLKTETRRKRGLEKINENPDELKFINIDSFGYAVFCDKKEYEELPFPGEFKIKSPYGKEGNYLWCRETWQISDWIHPSDENYGYIYKASENGKDWEENSRDWKWKQSILPKEACRLILKIESIGVERIQDITDEGAIAEGIIMNNIPHPGWYWMENVYCTDSPYLAYNLLWNKINGKESWDKNIWVWVIKFSKHILK